MFTTTVTSPSATVTSPPASPTRSRHRGLSYFRSYTHHRLSLSSSSNSNRNSNTNSNSAATAANAAISPTSSRPKRLSISRAQTFPLSLSTTSTAASTSQPAPNQAETGRRRTESNAEAPAATLQDPSQLAGIAEQTSRNSAIDSDDSSPALATSTAEETEDMARNRSTNRSNSSPTPATAGQRTTTSSNGSTEEAEDSSPPTIRFYPHQELPNGRPSLHFSPIVRQLPSQSSIIKVGRYSEREGIPVANPTAPSDAPVGFKSKVVSRKHCEFSFQNGSWHIKDVASSSGTFLNHVRLSQPNQVSRLFPVKDGDVVQLGIDFRGGEEMIFRCVKIRIECNRSWQQKPNKFNQERHAQILRKKPEAGAVTAGGDNSGECSICLSSVMPCQSLFVAPCAHVWHFKCIYPLLIGKRYPHFTCPNCRAIWNLEAEVDEGGSDEEWENAGPILDGQPGANGTEVPVQPSAPVEAHAAQDTGAGTLDADNDTSMITGELSMDENDEPTAPVPRVPSSSLLARRQPSGAAPQITTDPVEDIELTDAPPTSARTHVTDGHSIARVNSPNSAAVDILSGEGPLTPRNNAGPFVFDGSAGRPGSQRSQIVPVESVGL